MPTPTKRGATLREAIAERVLSIVRNFQAQHQTFVGNIAKDCSALGVDPKSLVTLALHLEAVESIKTAAGSVVKDQEAIVKDLNRQLADLKKEVMDLTEKLDAPSSAYQGYLEALRQWQSKRDAIVGDDQSPETINYI